MAGVCWYFDPRLELTIYYKLPDPRPLVQSAAKIDPATSHLSHVSVSYTMTTLRLCITFFPIKTTISSRRLTTMQRVQVLCAITFYIIAFQWSLSLFFTANLNWWLMIRKRSESPLVGYERNETPKLLEMLTTEYYGCL